MEVYPSARRTGLIKRIEPMEVVGAVLLMASRAKKMGCGTIFFPEIGGLPLKYIFQYGVIRQDQNKSRIFSSKVTAITKSPLSKQICGLLTSEERSQHLNNKQIIDFTQAINRLPQSLKEELVKAIDICHLEQYQLSELVSLIGEIGLYIPSEDKSNWVKDGVIAQSNDLIHYLPENNAFQEFQDFRKKIITYSIMRMPDIVHGTRALLNIILLGTDFAKVTQGGMIYVMDEAVSRGRTLNALDIIFKAFNSKATWKIGVLFCPLDITDHEKIDFIFSNKSIPSFSNRFDLLGAILVESHTAFIRYDIDQLLSQAQQSIPEHQEKQVVEYFKQARLFARNNLYDFLEDNIIDENDLVRLLHFMFVCSDNEIIKRCIDLNPTEIDGIIEEASFYINMPHPFEPMPIRKCYKDSVLNALKYISAIDVSSEAHRELKKIKEDFYNIKNNYELFELQCWSDRYHGMLSQLDYALTHK